MRSITLSTGDIYFESIIEGLKRISGIKKYKEKNMWFFVIHAKEIFLHKYSSEEQAKKDHGNLLHFLSQCKMEATNE